MEWCHINFWLLKKNRSKVTLPWSKLMTIDWLLRHVFLLNLLKWWRPLLETAAKLWNILEEWEVYSTGWTHKPLNGVHYTFKDRVLTYLLIVSFLCEWHQLHPRLQFKSPSCLLVVFPCLETPSRLCWAFSSFRHPPLCKSSSASSSSPRWGRHCHPHRVFCYFVWNNGDYDSFTTILHVV